MIKDFVVFLFFGSIVVSLGWLTGSFFIQKKNFGERIALSIPLGFGIISFILFFVYSIPFQFEKWNPLFVFIVIATTLVIESMFLSRREYELSNLNSYLAFKRFLRNKSIGYWIILICLCFVSLVFSIYFPTITPDGFRFDYLGKVMASTKDMSLYYLDTPSFRTPIVPLLHSYFYLFNIVYPKTIYSLFYLSIILFTYFRIKERVGDESYAIKFTLILATTPVFWWRSYLTQDNIVAASYFYFGVVFWFETLERQKEKNKKTYLLSGLCFALAVWSRAEFILFFIPAVLISIRNNSNKENLKKSIIYLCALPVIVSLMWLAVCSFSSEWPILKLRTYVILIAATCFCLVFFFGNKYYKIAVSLLLISALIIFEYYFDNYLGKFLSGIVKYISYFNFRFVLYIFLQGYWVFTVVLFLCIPFYWRGFNKSERMLSFFLISFYITVILVMISLHDTMSGRHGPARDYDIGIINAVKSLFINPGKHINGSSQRIYLAMYPILVFLAAHSLHKIKLRGVSFAKTYLPKIIVLGNIILLLIIFMLPRVKIILDNPSINHERILTTNQIKDIYNSYESVSEFAYKIKEVLPEDAIVFFPNNEAKGFIPAKSIIFPIVGISIGKPFKIDFTFLKPYKNIFWHRNFSTIYFASKKDTYPSNISSLKSTIFYKDKDWHILKLEILKES